MSKVGTIHSSEKTAFRDPETGAEIVQYTSVGQTNRTLYFTNRPYTCDGEHIVFLSDRTGANEMYLLHLQSGKIIQLTEGAGPANVSNCVHPRRPELYYRNQRAIYRVHLDTLKTEELLRAPDGFGFGILNLNNPPWLAFEMIEKLKGTTREANGTVGPAKAMSEQVFMRPRTVIYRMNIENGDVECVWGDLRLLTHVQISPTDPNLLIFSDCLQYGADRCYYLDLSKKVKSLPRPIFPESATARGSHECFTRRGNLYIQWMEGDLERFGEHTLYHGFRMLGGVPASDIDRAPFKKYEVPEKQKDLMHHFTMSLDETWGVHDRWQTAPNYDENISWLSLFRHQEEQPQTIVQKLCFHNGAKGDRLILGTELTLDDKDEWATYTSFLGNTANVCQVRVTPFVEKLMKTTANQPS